MENQFWNFFFLLKTYLFSLLVWLLFATELRRLDSLPVVVVTVFVLATCVPMAVPKTLATAAVGTDTDTDAPVLIFKLL